MSEIFFQSPFFGLTLLLTCWVLAVKIQNRTGWIVCNPVLVSSLMVVVFLGVFGIPYRYFHPGGALASMLLGPTTAVLALNIYQQRDVLKEHFFPVLAGCMAGSLGSILIVFLLCRFFETSTAFSSSMLPKSVTTAIALGISESGGGIPGITAAAVVITGIEGAVLAPFLAEYFHITDPVAEGVAIGACSHAIGTSKALEIGTVQGAMSSISLCLCGIITTVLAILFM
jgi:predicted murein hydrolase (TIGR00659 family)